MRNLKSNVIFVDPCINPDGGNRFATWVNHNKAKPGNRRQQPRIYRNMAVAFNYYWFDMN
ncbi:MAG: hypothetical protein IPH28_08125 [Cytophagaceae bacterium]|nr:hypothetical protein [Cytophagaceae bacterium]